MGPSLDFERIIQQEHKVGINLENLKINRSYISGQGISEPERERRTQSNLLTTKINFLAWVIEVKVKVKVFQKSFPPSLSGW